MVRRWGQSIAIQDKPTIITDPGASVHTGPQVADGNEIFTSQGELQGEDGMIYINNYVIINFGNEIFSQ